jgi:DNA-binding MarR family transcriptional regulator
MRPGDDNLLPYWKYIIEEVFLSGSKMTTPQSEQQSIEEIKGILQSLFRLRHHFRVVLPENLRDLKKRLFKNNRSNPVENVTDFDLFYNIGTIFSRHAEPLTMGELSQALDVPLSTATRIADWMVGNGYVRRLPDPGDRRVVRVAFTEAGMAIYHEIDTFFMERIEKLLHNFSLDERKTFIALLRKIIQSMEQEA